MQQDILENALSDWRMENVFSTADQINYRLTQHFLSDFESLNSWGMASVTNFRGGG